MVSDKKNAKNKALLTTYRLTLIANPSLFFLNGLDLVEGFLPGLPLATRELA